jgi:hypothetical protein
MIKTLLICLFVSLAACASQPQAGDAAVDQLSCAGQAAITCLIGNCGNDEGAESVCVNGVQACPPGSVQCGGG